jgi:hypothetical protein
MLGPMEQQTLVRGRWAFGLTVLAVGWGAVLLVGAFALPAYSSSTASDSASIGVPSASATLVEANGLGVLVPVGLPALIAAVVWFALHRKCSRGSRASGHVAWALVWLLIAFCLVAIASIGIFVAPVAALLAGAASLTPSGAPPSLPSPA